MTNTDAALRRAMYTFLIVATVAMTAGRVVSVERTFEPSMYADPTIRKWPTTAPTPTPMFSSNDRSRWATVRALVDHAEFSIGRRVADSSAEKGYRDEGIIFENDYASVDRILDPKSQLFYSSKPTLFTVAVAGEYWVLKHLFGWSIVERKWPVVCTVLLTVNVLPLALYLVLLSRLVERIAASDWAKLFVFTVACFGTFLTTFAVTLNNHLPAAFCVMAAAYPLLAGVPISRRAFAGAGFFAGLAATLELPAAAFVAGFGFLYLLRDTRRALTLFLPFALLPLAALALTNYLAIGEVIPAYAKFGGPWYEYPGSHWANPAKGGIDFAKEPTIVYAFHVLVGHHGVFSLSPVFLLSFAGMFELASQWRRDRGEFAAFGAVSLAISLVVVAFYIAGTNNYGGWTSGPRWFFWLTPLWLIAMIPVVDRMAVRPWTRTAGYAFLGMAVFAAQYALWNPWRHPWLYQLCEYLGWVRY